MTTVEDNVPMDSAAAPVVLETRPRRLSWRAYLLVGVTGFVFWLVVGLADSVWYTFTAMTKGDRPEIHEVMAWNLPLWLAAGLLTPAVVWIARQCVFRRGRVRRAVIVLLGGQLGFGAVHGVLTILLSEWLSGYPIKYSELLWSVRSFLSRSLDKEVLFYLLIVGAVQIFDLYHRFRERERVAAALELERVQLRASLTEARLDALKMQLQPHFLFNALNALSTLILRGDSAGAQTMVQLLSRFLRMTLDSTDSQLIPLETELEFLDAYLRIQKVRFGDRLKVEIEAAPETRSASVPSLILQPLVENSIRQGIGWEPGDAILVVRAARRGDTLHLRVEDNGRGLPEHAARSEGVGLQNTRARLAQLFPGQNRVALEDRPGGGTIATLEFPFAARASASPARTGVTALAREAHGSHSGSDRR